MREDPQRGPDMPSGGGQEALFRRQEAELQRELERTRTVDWVWATLAGLAAGAAAASIPVFWPYGGIPDVPPIVVEYHTHPVLALISGLVVLVVATGASHRWLRAQRARRFWGF